MPPATRAEQQAMPRCLIGAAGAVDGDGAAEFAAATMTVFRQAGPGRSSAPRGFVEGLQAAAELTSPAP
jgi:hypothetical protein